MKQGTAEAKAYINEKLLDKLEALAGKNGLPLNTLLEHIFREYLEKSELLTLEEEKRRYARKKVVSPALVYEETENGEINEDSEMGRYISTTIFDVSRGGVKLILSAKNYSELDFTEKGSVFEVVSYLSGNETLFRFRCKSQHVEKDDYTVRIGCAFEEVDAHQMQELSTHLVH